ncbi:MAG: tyrosine-type recombinase/integrase [Blastocatellia bacterium]|nr:tyrosine-type recombinase/integrase [Blastocatellia bacterium]MBL8193849.1 tyrosine-type recombinase/integrase [Blastocatellia bacterium]MBN8725707.1 tyrosine-type recombinase/integrase [Acidobacteriota bacterium]
MTLIPANIVKEFLEFLTKEQNLSTQKIDDYQIDLTSLEEFAQTKNKSLLTLDKKEVAQYLRQIQKNNTSKAVSVLSVVSLFYQFLTNKNYLHHNPTINLELPKAWQTMPKFLNKDEIDKLFSIADPLADDGIRDLAMLNLLYVTGIRVSELILIKLTDINLSNNTLTYLGRNNNSKDIVLDNKVIEILSKYLVARQRLLREKHSDLLFINNYGDEVTRQQFWRIIVNYGEKAGLGHITPHMLRHTFATHLLEHGADNTSIEMLEQEEKAKAADINYVANERIKSIYEKFHPRSR